MAIDIIELGPDDPEPSVVCNRRVEAMPAPERRLHAPDRHILALESGSLVARCSCWWTETAPLGQQQLGAIGHYAAADEASGKALLASAFRVLAEAGCTIAAGPLDGNTWRRYRFVVERGPEPPFFLEPENPDDWPAHWLASGFSPLAYYSSALNADLQREDTRTTTALPALTSAGISIRSFEASRAEEELTRMFRCSIVAFKRNFLYSPIREREFMTQNRSILPFVRPELVLMAERGSELVGFMFALPDLLQAGRGQAVDTVILKTIAVHPDLRGMGLGATLIDLVQRAARQLGFRRAIHALMHEQNVSRRISNRYARTIRRYALFARQLRP